MRTTPNGMLVNLVVFVGALLSAGSVRAEPQNLAVLGGAKATQSSEAFGGNPAKANDDCTDGNFASRCVSHTNLQPNAWWQLALRNPSTVTRVVLWNRTDCCAERLANFRVLLLDADGIELWKADYPGLGGERRLIIDVPETPSVSKVRIQLMGDRPEYLHLAEVQIYGDEPEVVVPTIIEKHEIVVMMTTTQKIRDVLSNPGSIEQKFRIVYKTVEGYNSKASVESIREEVRTSQFNYGISASTNVSAMVMGANGAASLNASAGSQYSNLVKTFYKTTGEVEEYKSSETIKTRDITLAPGEKWTIYTNTTSGGSYTNSYDTTERLTEEDARPVRVVVTVERDLTPVFNEMCGMVVEVNNGIGKSGTKMQWNWYAQICVDARTKGIRHYIKQVLKQLRDDSKMDDDYSWHMVKVAARKGDETSDDAIALANVLGGFLIITQPSQDVWAWRKLKAVSNKYLYEKR
jgi:hypothetical protein